MRHRSVESQIYVLPEGRRAAHAFLDQDTDAHSRLERVSRLIEGFETPYGLEMLATLHWSAQEDSAAATDPEVAISRVHSWSERKRSLFKPQHLRKAWLRLSDQGWFSHHSRSLTH